ncbi:MAG: YfhO family protein [Spirochaetes bacterium]|nr:YfhO family protein [Spirochaetota bacterium]
MNKKWFPFVIIFLIALFPFAQGLFTDEHVRSGDNSPLENVLHTRALDGASYNSGWMKHYLSGTPRGVMPYSIQYFAIKLFSPVFYLKFTYFFCLLLAGIFFYLLLLSHNLNRQSALFGAIALMLSNHFITLVYPGHLGKFMSFAWIPLVYLFLRKGVVKDKIRPFLYSGFFLGLSFHGAGFQVSFYFAVLTFFYFMFLVLNKRAIGEKIITYLKQNIKPVAKLIAGYTLMVLMTIIITFHILPNITRQADSKIGGKASVSDQQKWDFATQWSLPFEETLDFFIPGIFGWKSGHKDSPYWGRMGQSPQQAQQGRSGYKLNSENVGLIAVLFVIFAFFVSRKDRKTEHRFWLFTIITAIILSFGRFLYVPYWLFYKLPYMDTVRNPNKFIWLISFAVPVIAAYGFNYLFHSDIKKNLAKRADSFIKWLKIGLAVLTGLLLISIVAMQPLTDLITARTGNSYGAGKVAGNIPVILLISIIVLSICYFVFSRIFKGEENQKKIQYLGYLVIGILAFELWFSARHFVEFSKQPPVSSSDGLVEYIKTKKGPFRVRFAERTRMMQHYLSNKFPYHKITAVNFLAISRLSGRYTHFFSGLNRNLKRQMQLLNIKYIITLREQNEDSYKLIKEFKLRKGSLRIYEYLDVLPRVFLAGNYKLFDDKTKLVAYMAGTNFNPKTTVCVEKEFSAPLTLLSNFKKSTNTAETNSKAVLSDYRQNKIHIDTESSSQKILVLQDYYHKDWHVYIDDKPGRIFPVNMISRGVVIPPGKHKVYMVYKPSGRYFYVTMTGYLILLTLLVFELVIFLRKKQIPDPDLARTS